MLTMAEAEDLAAEGNAADGCPVLLTEGNSILRGNTATPGLADFVVCAGGGRVLWRRFVAASVESHGLSLIRDTGALPRG